MRPLLLLTGFLSLAALGSHAQRPPTGRVSYVSVAGRGPGATPPAPSAGKPAATTVFVGRVVNPTGATLPGAVVKLVGTNQLAVTNGDGSFSFAVPATNESLQVLVSYAGFENELAAFSPRYRGATVMLSTPTAIKVAGNQQMKAYLRTAHRQVKRSLRHL